MNQGSCEQEARQDILPKDSLSNKFTRVARPIGSAFKKALEAIQDERGGSDNTLFWFGTGVVLAILILSISQSCTADQQNRKIEALQKEIVALKAPDTSQSSPELIKEIYAPNMKFALWYQGRVTIAPSDALKPSKVSSGDFNKDRNPGNLVNWNDILEVNGTSMEKVVPFTVDKPLTNLSRLAKDRGNAILNLVAPSYDFIDMVALKVVMKNELGIKERFFVYLPSVSLEGYDIKKGSINIIEKNGKYYQDANYIGKTEKVIPADQIGAVSLLK